MHSAGAYIDDALVGYIIYNPVTARICQFAVDPRHRGKGLGRQLFAYASRDIGKPWLAINIDSHDAGTAAFFSALGISPHVQQYEMERAI